MIDPSTIILTNAAATAADRTGPHHCWVIDDYFTCVCLRNAAALDCPSPSVFMRRLARLRYSHSAFADALFVVIA